MTSLISKKETLALMHDKLYKTETELRDSVLSLNQEKTLYLMWKNKCMDYLKDCPIKYIGNEFERILIESGKYNRSTLEIFFLRNQRQYKDLLFEYNTLALEINFMAERLGEPPVLLEDAYEPDIK
jgi:hypothetical protein